MRILRIYLENFMAHRQTDIDCSQFRSALVVGRINSDPRESNGVGKSTIFRAIVFALYGEADIKLERIVRRGADRCLVTLEFEINGSTYRVTRKRTRKNNKAELEIWTKGSLDWENISNRTNSQTEEDLAKIVRINSVAFQHSVLFAQNSVAGLASATATERKNLLKEPFHLSIYSKYEKAAKDRASALAKEIDKVQNKIEDLGNPLADITLLQKLRSDARASFDENEKNCALLLETLDSFKAHLADIQKIKQEDPTVLKNQHANVLRELVAARRRVIEIQSNVTQDEGKKASVSKEISTSQSNLELLEKNHSELLAKEARSKDVIRADVDKMVSKEIDGKALLSKLKSDLEIYQRPLPDGSTCDHCRQTINPDHRKVCDSERQVKLQTVATDITKYKEALVKVIAKKSAFEQELQGVDSRNSSLQTFSTRIQTRKAEIVQGNKLLSQIEETLASRKKELDAASSTRDDLEKQVEELARQLQAKTDDSLKKDIEKTTQNIEQTEKQLGTAKSEGNSFAVSMGVLTEKIAAKQADKEKLDFLLLESAKIEKEHKMRLRVQQSFSPSGIPTMIINTILDDLQIETNDLLSQLNSGIELLFLVSKTNGDGKEKDTLDIVYRINGEEFEWKELSGGKQMMVSLCLKLALSIIIQRRVNVSIKFLMLDEVESQFDDKTKDAFISLIKKWQENYTIFVVTHNNDLKDKFNHAILVEGDNVNDVTGRLVSAW